jgi:hypothetical protein
MVDNRFKTEGQKRSCRNGDGGGKCPITASLPFIVPAQWQACAGTPLELGGREVFGGLDLSATRI